MNVINLKSTPLVRTVFADVILLALMCLVPTLSHLFAVPIYKYNPMLFCLLASMLLVGDRRNAYLMAVLLPVVSMLLCGMPAPLKMLCMVPELLTVVFVFNRLYGRANGFVAILSAIMAGKVVYYGLKMLILSPAVLISTDVSLQFAVSVVFALVFALVLRAKASRS